MFSVLCQSWPVPVLPHQCFSLLHLLISYKTASAASALLGRIILSPVNITPILKAVCCVSDRPTSCQFVSLFPVTGTSSSVSVLQQLQWFIFLYFSSEALHKASVGSKSGRTVLFFMSSSVMCCSYMSALESVSAISRSYTSVLMRLGWYHCSWNLFRMASWSVWTLNLNPYT